MFQDASNASAAPTEVIMTTGALKAVERGKTLTRMYLTFQPDSITMEAPDSVWFHILHACTLSSEQCTSCSDVAEVLQRALFEP